MEYENTFTNDDLVQEEPLFSYEDINRLEREITPEMSEALPQPVVEYMTALDEVANRLHLQLKRAQEQTEKAYESKRALAQQFDNYKLVAEQKLMFMQSAVNNIQQAMRLIGGSR